MTRAQPIPFAPSRQANWDVRAAANFIAGGTGAGLLVLAALAPGSGLDPRWPVALGVALVAAGLASVWLEIGRPWRALHVLFHPQTSWMTREAIVAPFLFAAGAAAFWWGGALLAPAAVLAAAFLYCQARILRAAKGVPAWRQPATVPLIVATGLTEGAGALALLAHVLGAGQRPRALWILLLGLLVLRAAAWHAYRRQLRRAGAPGATFAAYRAFGPWFLGLGHWLPGLLLAVALAGGPRWPMVFAAGAAVLAGGWLKLVIVTRAGYNQGFALPVVPVRGAGRPQPGARPGWQQGGAG